MLSGQLYIANDPELSSEYYRSLELCRKINSLSYKKRNKRDKLFKSLLGETKGTFTINSPFYCDYGSNITIGKNFYANYGCTILDVAKVVIGDNVFFGPHVSLFTAGHPLDKEIRREGLEFGKPITIEDDVWIGGNVVINPGVTIGAGSVIGSGSVVTKDIKENSLALGNPARVIREISKEDQRLWLEQREKYYSSLAEETHS